MIKGIIVFQERKDTKFSSIYCPLDTSCLQKLKNIKKQTGPYNYPNNTVSSVLLLKDQARLEVLDYKHIQNTVISDSWEPISLKNLTWTSCGLRVYNKQ